MNLQEIQALLQEEDISAYYLAATKESPIAQLVIEVQTAERETNHLEICTIPTPEEDIFLLQLFMQLPLPSPFKPDDCIPDFLLSEVYQYIAVLNQMLPLPGFNSTDAKIYFRHIFATSQPSIDELLYIVDTISKLIQICQPAIQQVAIGFVSAEEAIQDIAALFVPEEEDSSSSSQ